MNKGSQKKRKHRNRVVGHWRKTSSGKKIRIKSYLRRKPIDIRGVIV